jgi:hypothetical protein
MDKSFRVNIDVTVYDMAQLRDYAMQRALVDARMPAAEFETGESEDAESNISYWLGWAFDAGTPEGCGFQMHEAETRQIAARAAESDIQDALDAAQLAIDEYYNGDRDWGAQWLLNAHKANPKC